MDHPLVSPDVALLQDAIVLSRLKHGAFARHVLLKTRRTLLRYLAGKAMPADVRDVLQVFVALPEPKRRAYLRTMASTRGKKAMD